MSPAESGVTSGVATTGAGTSDGTGGLGGHHGHPAAAAAIAANNASSSSSTSPSTTAAAAAVFGGGAAAAAAALWSKAPPSAAAAAAAAAAIYGEDFPMEARYALTGWLDLYFNEELELGNPEHEEHARRLIMNMVQQLETKAASEADFSSKSRLEEVIENIKVGCVTVQLIPIMHAASIITAIPCNIVIITPLQSVLGNYAAYRNHYALGFHYATLSRQNATPGLAGGIIGPWGCIIFLITTVDIA